MQEHSDNISKLKLETGILFRRLREKHCSDSLNKFALAYDINRANLSKIERGEVGCSFVMAWKISEALGIKLSDFVAELENVLGEDFKLIDE